MRRFKNLRKTPKQTSFQRRHTGQQVHERGSTSLITKETQTKTTVSNLTSHLSGWLSPKKACSLQHSLWRLIGMTYVSTDGQVDKDVIHICTDTHTHTCIYVHTHDEGYSTIKNKEILAFMTWVNTEDTILSEISQRKANTVWSHWYVESKKKVKLTKKQSRMVVVRGWGRGNGEMLLKGYKFSFLSSKNIICSLVTIANNSVLYTWNLLRANLKWTHHTHKKLTVRWWML